MPLSETAYDVTHVAVSTQDLRRMEAACDLLDKIYAEYHAGSADGMLFEVQCHEQTYLELIKK